jgi:hypothetical protein
VPFYISSLARQCPRLSNDFTDLEGTLKGEGFLRHAKDVVVALQVMADDAGDVCRSLRLGPNEEDDRLGILWVNPTLDNVHGHDLGHAAALQLGKGHDKPQRLHNGRVEDEHLGRGGVG